MKHPFIAIILASLLCAQVSPCFADDSYYIEVGDDTSQAEAPRQWDALVAKHKRELEKLKFYPKTMIGAAPAANTRIQAGPIAGREQAQKVCTRLFKQDVSCFVIAGLGAAPPSAMRNMSEESIANPVQVVQLPWNTESGIAPPPPAPIQTLTVASVPEVAPLPVPEERKASVSVAEAIRVPLTQGDDQQQGAQVVVKSLPDITPLTPMTSSGDGKYVDESDISGEGWLSVSSFPDEESAASFWGEVRHANTKSAKKLHVRIISPLLAKGSHRISLNVGPFANSSEAYRFCREAIQAKARGFTCGFSHDLPDAGNANGISERKKPTENPDL